MLSVADNGNKTNADSSSSRSGAVDARDFSVKGMSCAACSSRVERAVSSLEGVSECSVSLLTNSMRLKGSVSDEEVISAVEKAGYHAERKGVEGKKPSSPDSEALKDTETPVLKRRLILSLGFLMAIVYLTMGNGMLGLPVPDFIAKNPAAGGLLQLLLSAIVMIINKKFFTSGFKALFHRAPNMDTLVALGSMSSFVWSVFSLFVVLEGQRTENLELVTSYSSEFYFESCAMILTLITVGKLLEARSKGRTADAIRGLIELAPKQARIVVDGAERLVPVESVKAGDIFIVKAGESVPVDGVVISGSGSLNESALTGESIPVDKSAEDRVYAASISLSGHIVCRAERVGEDTTLSRIIALVSETSATKAPIAKTADRVSGVFVPVVITLSVLTLAVWLIIGRDIGFSLSRAISVLVISCPCALGLATPVAIMVGSGVGARNGILFKTALSLEETGKADKIVLDKTGTVTTGRPVVTDIIPAEGVSRERLLSMAVSLEDKSSHPLARAVVSLADSEKIELFEASDFKTHDGSGVSAAIDGMSVLGGSLRYISGIVSLDAAVASVCQSLSEKGKTPLLFSAEDRLLGIIAVADSIKEDSPEAVAQLKELGLEVIMLTGDNEATARAIGAVAGVDRVIAGVLPDGKERVIRELMEGGSHVIMVGDGINDAPALTRADIGIAIGAGSDIAIDSADVVLMKSSLKDACAAIRLSRYTLRNIKENLFWAFIYNMIGIPLAMGALSWAGLTLSPMFGAAAMSLSSFCVVSNALRLNLCKIYRSGGKDGSRAQPTAAAKPSGLEIESKTNSEKENKKMSIEKTIYIEGMMCSHCENHVKTALKAVPGVLEATASHTDKRAVVTLSQEVDGELLKKAVEEQGYSVTKID